MQDVHDEAMHDYLAADLEPEPDRPTRVELALEDAERERGR